MKHHWIWDNKRPIVEVVRQSQATGCRSNKQSLRPVMTVCMRVGRYWRTRDDSAVSCRVKYRRTVTGQSSGDRHCPLRFALREKLERSRRGRALYRDRRSSLDRKDRVIHGEENLHSICFLSIQLGGCRWLRCLRKLNDRM